MIAFLRSLVFNVLFYSWTLLCLIVFLPFLLFPRSVALIAPRIWSYGVVWICECVLGLHFTLIGQEKFLTSPAIFAAKHQSAWETIIFHYLLKDPAIVLKKELLWIPLFGWYVKKLQMIPLSRSKENGRQDLKKLIKEAERAVSEGRPIIIFPEGTRSKPGQKTTYFSGVASLYLQLNIPVIPIAHNSGLFWPRRGFFKIPGRIMLELVDPIQPGLSRQEFMRLLENEIETKTNELVHEGLAYGKNKKL